MRDHVDDSFMLALIWCHALCWMLIVVLYPIQWWRAKPVNGENREGHIQLGTILKWRPVAESRCWWAWWPCRTVCDRCTPAHSPPPPVPQFAEGHCLYASARASSISSVCNAHFTHETFCVPFPFRPHCHH